MQFDFYFEFTHGNSWPELRFNVNATEERLPEEQYCLPVIYHVTTDVDEIIISNINKKESDTVVENGCIIRDQTVRLVKIIADDIMLDPNFVRTHMSFCPVYSAGYLDYCRKNNIVPPETVHEDTIYFNGEWRFKFDVPFWNWYAEERMQINAKHFSKQELELYIGTNNNNHNELFEELKALIKNHA